MSKKRFLKLPEYPGGKEQFRDYIRKNLRYPDDALRNRIEGIVHLTAEIDDNGNVLGVNVDKGIGHGCDEEAVRLISELIFGGVHNKGLRVKTKKKFKIQFKIKEETAKDVKIQNAEIRYSIKPSEPASKSSNSGSGGYTYSIPLQKP